MMVLGQYRAVWSVLSGDGLVRGGTGWYLEELSHYGAELVDI